MFARPQTKYRSPAESESLNRAKSSRLKTEQRDLAIIDNLHAYSVTKTTY